MSPLQIGVIGASMFTPELTDLLVKYTDSIGPVDLRLMDVDPQKAEIVGELCQRIIAKGGKPVTLRYTQNYEDTVTGCDYVLVQFRVGGTEARIADDNLGLKYRIPFVETVSVCGFSQFLRSYYELEKIAEAVKRHAPNAWLLNFANPAGMLAESFSKLGLTKVVGVCNASIFFKDFFGQTLGAEPDALFMNWRGLNHLTVIDDVRFEGRNVYPEIIDKLGDTDMAFLPFPSEFLDTTQFLPNYYLRYHYFKEQVVDELQKKGKTRAEEVKAVNDALLEEYKTLDHVPEALKQRGGYGYSRAVANLIRGLETGDSSVHYAVVRNGSTLAEMPADSFVEVPVITMKNDVRALQVEPLPTLAKSTIVTMKDYETTLIEGARLRDRDLLLTAMMIHPLIGSYSLGEPLLRDVLAQNQQYLPGALFA